MKNKLIIELKNIVHSFSPEKQILKDISFSLKAGGVYALMGNNGSGKTTLFNIISGFIKAEQGDIFFSQSINGKAAIQLIGLPPHKINQLGICRTFQDLRTITKLSVRSNIILACQNNPADNILNAILPKSVYRIKNKNLESIVKQITEDFFLSDIQDHMAGDISFGQQKLLTLACCVANGASLLLLDEPVAGLQPVYRKKIASLIKQLKQDGKTILLIEHNNEFIEEIVDKIFFLHDGRTLEFSNIDALKKNLIVTKTF